MSSEAVQQLLESGQRSGLYSAEIAQELIKQLTADSPVTADETAARMVEKKILTPYQAEQLLAGRADECVVAGRYRILEKLGAGGMGTVYKAHDTQLDRDVAVKVLPSRSLNEADAIARFQREARALAKVSHPNIIQAYDNGADKGRHFLVMEYVDGVNLAAILREQGAIPPTLAADIIYQVALGLQHAHEKGLVHRDLKPSNLLLSHPAFAGCPPPTAKDQARQTPAPRHHLAAVALSNAIVKILDLGLARFLQDHIGDAQVTKEGIGVGTPDYMAPEQFRDALHADARTDIYGLGCTLYQLISGAVPFPGSSFAEKADAHAKKEPIPLEERCPEVPAGLAFVVSKMMAKHPAERFQTAAEVANALAPYVAGASHSMILLRQTMRFHAGQLTMWAPNRRKRLLAWSGTAIVSACFVTLLILAWPRIFPPDAHEPTNGSQARTKGPGDRTKKPGDQTKKPGDQTKKPATKVSEPPEPKLIENGLTVAKDGTGQCTTIGEALAKVKPGQTIRVLDKATYTEAIRIDNRTRMAGITLESPQGATIIVPADAKIGLLVFQVPRVTVRGFRLDAAKGPTFLMIVAGRTPGASLEALDVRSASGSSVGVSIEQLGLLGDDAPITVRNCEFAGLYRGIRVSGMSDTGKPTPSRRAVLHDNAVSDCTVGIWAGGLISDVHIVGNRAWNCQATLQIEDLFQDCSNVLIANNSFLNETSCIQIQDLSQPVKGIAIRNNLFMAGRGPDLEFLGANQKFVANLRFDHNWREVRAPPDKTAEARSWIPFSPQDVHTKNQIAVISRDPKDIDFLRPKKSSPLATRGAGGDLPSYVGALPPEGVQRWDWEKTWKAQGRKSEQPASKSGKD